MYEVEKKFVYNKENKEGVDHLIADSTFFKEVVNDDVYYDTENYDLLVKETYLRTRNGSFELKISQSKKTKSIREIEQHIEIENDSEIRDYLNIKGDGDLKNDLEKAGYSLRFSYKVIRKKYKNGDFAIDFDKADYGFTSVEIELLVETEKEMNMAIKKIRNFAKSYGLIKSPMRGKLFEYIYRNNKKAWEKVVNANIV